MIFLWQWVRVGRKRRLTTVAVVVTAAALPLESCQFSVSGTALPGSGTAAHGGRAGVSISRLMLISAKRMNAGTGLANAYLPALEGLNFLFASQIQRPATPRPLAVIGSLGRRAGLDYEAECSCCQLDRRRAHPIRIEPLHLFPQDVVSFLEDRGAFVSRVYGRALQRGRLQVFGADCPHHGLSKLQLHGVSFGSQRALGF